ncbi:hypothetical protein LCGC14_1068390 [marine sediment metagenome]|uniref:Uncharacterized protein n=1 Tax=marine sediment metagenome TaxID=412755 RepID=A0A0F9N669_9ZZZZ
MITKTKLAVLGTLLLSSLFLFVSNASAQVGIQEDIQGFITEFASLFMFIIVALIFVDVLMFKIAGVSILKWIFERFGA